MFVARGYGSQQQYAAAMRSSSYSISSGSNVWVDLPGVLPFPPTVMVGDKIQVVGAGPYVVTGLSTFNNSGCQIRIVRNSTANILATGPASAFTAYTSNPAPVTVDLEDGDLVWLQILRNTTLTRSLSSASLELAPVE